LGTLTSFRLMKRFQDVRFEEGPLVFELPSKPLLWITSRTTALERTLLHKHPTSSVSFSLNDKFRRSSQDPALQTVPTYETSVAIHKI
jgi:hypothetical protein